MDPSTGDYDGDVQGVRPGHRRRSPINPLSSLLPVLREYLIDCHLGWQGGRSGPPEKYNGFGRLATGLGRCPLSGMAELGVWLTL